MRMIDALGMRTPKWKPAALATGSAIFLLSAMQLVTLGQAPASPSDPRPAPPQASPTTEPTPESSSAQSPSEARSSPAKDPLLSAGTFSLQTKGGEVDEDQLKQLLAGKTLYLRSGYQDNNLEFDEWGRLTGHSSQGSFTLSQIQINKVRLTKHALKLEGDRYGLHFLGAATYEDPTQATDRVKITPKKKTVRISFDREQVEKPRKEKHKRKHNDGAASGKDSDDDFSANAKLSAAKPEKLASLDHPTSDKVTRTTDPVHASQLLLNSLDKVFSPGIDERMIAAMPDFWKSYYQASAQKVDYKPSKPGVYLQNSVDRKAKLVSALDPPSNEYAQANGVAGMALYHAVVGADGKVQTVVAGRPIGFGLDENAEKTIRNASFQPAMKDGKPVSVALDVVVSFRIYSKRTSQPGASAQDSQTAEEKTDKTRLPGPYTVQSFQQTQGAQPSQPAETTKAPR